MQQTHGGKTSILYENAKKEEIAIDSEINKILENGETDSQSSLYKKTKYCVSLIQPGYQRTMFP